MRMESTVAEAQANAERVEVKAAEHLANYTTKVEAEWQTCGFLRERLLQLQSDVVDIETMYKRKVARLEEQLATLQADNASLRSTPRLPRPGLRSTPRLSRVSTPRASLPQVPLSGASESLTVERLRAHDEVCQESCRPSLRLLRKASGARLRARANSEPHLNPCGSNLALTRNGEHARPPWTARNSAATHNSELSRPPWNSETRVQARAGHGKTRTAERLKGTQLSR